MDAGDLPKRQQTTLEIILDIRFPDLSLNMERKEYNAGMITIQL